MDKTHIKHGYTSMVHVARGAIRIQGYKFQKQWHNLCQSPAPGGSGPKAQLHSYAYTMCTLAKCIA